LQSGSRNEPLRATSEVYPQEIRAAMFGCAFSRSRSFVVWCAIITKHSTQVDARTTICDARPPRDDALHSPRLGAPIGRQGARLVPLVARVGDHGRSRRRKRSAAAQKSDMDSFELRRRLVCPPSSPACSPPSCVTLPPPSCPQRYIRDILRVRQQLWLRWILRLEKLRLERLRLVQLRRLWLRWFLRLRSHCIPRSRA